MDTRTYPGGLAAPDDLLRLAHAYRNAAQVLESAIDRRKPLSRAPFRLSALHAVELYLSALLLHCGHTPGGVRSLQHDFAARTERAVAGGLVLRRRTAAHLAAVSASREYVATRYGAELPATRFQVNRLSATLDEVAEKVTALVARPR